MPNDDFGIARVDVASWQETYRGLLPEEYLAALRVDERSSRWRRVLQSLNSEFMILVAEQGGDVIGFIYAGINRDEDSEYLGELYALYLLPSWLRRGMGRQLVQAVATQLMGVGLNSMMVEVLRENWGARSFYTRLGGEYLGERTLEFEAGSFPAVAYGWRDLKRLLP
ncbi:MAG: GNAT family N-acetyltransferase [Candidatus Dormibacteraceae bacterium]